MYIYIHIKEYMYIYVFIYVFVYLSIYVYLFFQYKYMHIICLCYLKFINVSYTYIKVHACITSHSITFCSIHSITLIKHMYVYIYVGFLKWGYPQIIHLNKIFHYKPSSYWGSSSRENRAWVFSTCFLFQRAAGHPEA